MLTAAVLAAGAAVYSGCGKGLLTDKDVLAMTGLFVASNYDDYKWARAIIEYYRLAETCTVIISPVFDRLDPKILAEWIINDNLNVRLQFQLHKYIWGPDVRGV